MAKAALSRGAFRRLVAFYAAKAHLDHTHDGECCVLKLVGSSEDVPHRPVRQWSDETPNGCACYDHASDFLHVLLRDLEREENPAGSDSARSWRPK
jgi:hypothetical protein